MVGRGGRPARWPLVGLAVVFAGAGGLALLSSLSAGDGAGRPAAPLEVPLEQAEGEPAPVLLRAGHYAVTYRVEGVAADGTLLVDTERRWVRPPYESRVETVAGEDPEGPVTFLQIAGFGYVQTGREGESPTVLAVEPAVAPGDARVGADLDAALASGALEWRHEVRTVLGRRCQVFRAAAPIDVTTLAAPEPGSWADLCVGDDGVVLHEEWVIDREVFRRRIAVALDRSPITDDGLFEPSGAAPEPRAGGVLAELTADSRPPDVAFYELAQAPRGFAHRGRFGYTPPRPPLDPSAPEPQRIALVLDVYEDRDGGMLVVANGTTGDNRPFVQPGEGATLVAAGALGPAELVLGVRQQELRIGFPRGRFLRVWGTPAVDDLVALTAGLAATTDPDATVSRR